MVTLQQAETGLYYTDKSFALTLGNQNVWEKIDFSNYEGEEKDAYIKTIAEKVKTFAIVTGYYQNGNNVDPRSTFFFSLPTETELKEREEYNERTEYGTIQQWHYFLAYKDIFDVIVSKKQELYPDEKFWFLNTHEYTDITIWTKSVYNEGDENQNNGIHWGVDVVYNTARFIPTNGSYSNIPVCNVIKNQNTNTQESYTKTEALAMTSAYYTFHNPNVDGAIFYPLKQEMSEFKVTPKFLTFNTNNNVIKPFFVEIEESKNVKNYTWNSGDVMLTKNQWEIFMAHKDLVDKVYFYLNNPENTEGTLDTLDTYGIPGIVWTKSNYNVKENTIGYYEVNNVRGKGIKWGVCPSLGTSHIIFRNGPMFNFPKVGLWE